MHIWLYHTLYEVRFICTIEFLDHIQLSTRIMQKKRREAKLRLVVIDQDGYQRYFFCRTESEESDTSTRQKI